MTAVALAREFARLKALQRLLRLYEVAHGDVFGISRLRHHVVLEMRRVAKLIGYGLPVLALLALTMPAVAQTNHAQHHPTYKNWVNKDGAGCCNDQDCGELAGDNEREKADGTVEVKIEGEWCPVYAKHYLKTGNAPNWSVSHVCVVRGVLNPGQGPCRRLICYQPKPGT